MKAVTDILVAVMILVSGAYISPKIIREFKMATLEKLDRGLPSLESFSKKLTLGNN